MSDHSYVRRLRNSLTIEADTLAHATLNGGVADRDYLIAVGKYRAMMKVVQELDAYLKNERTEGIRRHSTMAEYDDSDAPPRRTAASFNHGKPRSWGGGR